MEVNSQSTPVMPVKSKNLKKTTESVNMESRTAKAVKKPEDMIASAVRRLKDPKGSSLADIKKFLISKYQEDAINGINVKKVLKQAVNRGTLSELGGKYQVAERGRRRKRSKGSPKPRRRKSGSRRKSKSRRSGSKRRRRGSKRRRSGSKRRTKSRRTRRRSGGSKRRRSGSRKKSSGSKRRSRTRRRHKAHVEGDGCE